MFGDEGMPLLERIADGRPDLMLDYLAQGHAANSADGRGVSWIQWCAYHGDVNAIRYLVSHGASVDALGAWAICPRVRHTWEEGSQWR